MLARTPLRTLQRYVSEFDKHALDGLARKKPANAGKPRVFVSRKFDAAYRAAGYADELLPQLGDVVDEALKGLWKGRAGVAGSNDLGDLAAFLLLERCEELGIALPPDAFTIGDRRIAKWSDRKVVNLRNNEPRRSRTRSPASRAPGRPNRRWRSWWPT